MTHQSSLPTISNRKEIKRNASNFKKNKSSLPFLRQQLIQRVSNEAEKFKPKATPDLIMPQEPLLKLIQEDLSRSFEMTLIQASDYLSNSNYELMHVSVFGCLSSELPQLKQWKQVLA